MTVKAYAYDRYGPPEVVHPTTLPRPEPAPTEVRVRVVATTISSGDWRARSLNLPRGMGLIGRLFFGITAPRRKVLGTELSGIIDAVGRDVTRFSEGDAVVAFPGSEMGAHAEYILMPEDGRIAPAPASLGFEEAAALSFGGTTAYDFLVNKAGIRAGERVLVNGASGAVGTATVQLAKHLGAHVTGVCSGRNADMVLQIGADAVIDYTREDFTRAGPFDVTIDTVGSAPWRKAKKALRRGGRHVAITAGLGDMLFGPLKARLSGKRMIVGVASEAPEVLAKTVALAAAGHLRPVVDQVFAFDQIVAAHAHVDTGRKRGNVVVSVSPA